MFSLEAASTAICLLIQLEKHVTEEAGITPSVYTRKEPVSCSSSTIYAPTHIKLPSISYSAYSHLVYCILIYTHALGTDEVGRESWQLITAIHDEDDGLTLCE